MTGKEGYSFHLPKNELPLEVNLVTSPLLQTVVDTVGTQIPDWDTLYKLIKKDFKDFNDAGSVAGRIAEIHI